jgi:hypothetical protein
VGSDNRWELQTSVQTQDTRTPWLASAGCGKLANDASARMQSWFTTPSVFERNLQCEPVRKWPFEKNAIGHTPARFKRAACEPMAFSRVNFCRKSHTLPAAIHRCVKLVNKWSAFSMYGGVRYRLTPRGVLSNGPHVCMLGFKISPKWERRASATVNSFENRAPYLTA